MALRPARRAKAKDNRRKAGTRNKLYDTSHWRRVFMPYLKRERPICELCNEKPTTTGHHVRGLRSHPEDAYDATRIQAVCTSCHAIETNREMYGRQAGR